MKKTITVCIVLLLALNSFISAAITSFLYKYEKAISNEGGVLTIDDCSCRIRFEEQQLFYGYWKITDLVAPDYSIPSSYSGIDNDGFVRGKDWTKLCGTAVKITPEYIEHKGMQYRYSEHHSPEVFVLPVNEAHNNSDETSKNVISYYADKTLGFDGEYVPVMDFALDGNNHVTDYRNYPPREGFSVYDFNKIYLLDKNTAYFSDGVLMFLLERSEEK